MTNTPVYGLLLLLPVWWSTTVAIDPTNYLDLEVQQERTDFFTIATDAVRLTEASYFTSPIDVDERFDYFDFASVQYGPVTNRSCTNCDNAIVARRQYPYHQTNYKEVCFIAFNGVSSIDDSQATYWEQTSKLSSPNDGQFVSFVGVTTFTRTQTSIDTLVKQNLLTLLDSCYKSCVDPTCKLVITGHSAGAAEAVVFPNYLSTNGGSSTIPTEWITNPLVITSGGVAPIRRGQASNLVYDSALVYNLIRAPGKYFNYFFDPAPFVFSYQGQDGYYGFSQRIGSDIYLSNSNDMIWYTSTTTSTLPERFPMYGLFNLIFATLHPIGQYKSVMERITPTKTTVLIGKDDTAYRNSKWLTGIPLAIALVIAHFNFGGEIRRYVSDRIAKKLS